MRFLLVKSHPGQNWVALLLQYRKWAICHNKSRAVRSCLMVSKESLVSGSMVGREVNLLRQWHRSKKFLC